MDHISVKAESGQPGDYGVATSESICYLSSLADPWRGRGYRPQIVPDRLGKNVEE
jgi:hypothetical protein